MEAFEDEVTVSNDELQQVTTLALLQRSQEQHVTKLEGDLKDAKRKLRKTCEDLLPTLLDEIGLLSISLTDGSVIKIDETLYATIAKKNKAEAAEWLEENGQGSLVQTDVTLTFATGEQEKLHRLVDLLDSTEFSGYSSANSMNTGSVKAVIKELLAQGVDVPLSLFGAHFVKKTIISTP